MSETGDAPRQEFRKARDFLLAHRLDYDTAVGDFHWPALASFNWVRDHFDPVATDPVASERSALRIVEEDRSERSYTYADMKDRSERLAGWLARHGVSRGDRIVLMLGNQVELWDVMLASMRLGAVVIPCSTMLQTADLIDRIERGKASHVVADGAEIVKFAKIDAKFSRFAVGGDGDWLDIRQALQEEDLYSMAATSAAEPLLLYFTSGTTALPKLVEHSQVSYPVGHLSTMYWIGIQPGDVHLNISSPGWAKHAWSSFFAPWNAEATILVYNYSRFSANALLDVLCEFKVTTFCAPPTVWRMLIQADLGRVTPPVRELVAAGEPLNPEVIAQVEMAWGIRIRDGFGQTESTVAIANSPGQHLVIGSMGRPVPGYQIKLVDPVSGLDVEGPDAEGEICYDLDARPMGLMNGYLRGDVVQVDDGDRRYHTGDVGHRDEQGYITYVGRADDVFKASDYRISPFELESVLLEHPAVAEAAVVPAPDPVRMAVIKGFVTLADGYEPDAKTAASIFDYTRTVLPPFKRIRRLEFTILPKTISGKIRRVDLRRAEADLSASGQQATGEFRDN